ncbi:CMGC/DYRK/YAK protein kinase [Phakopsora pachyrhizi]|uniref:CMGC/DYRK/YAK protein kinase n=1 Tax=Phakopsora pachyrhizi TaxID=170000 RepID=A0AAV0BNE2_PHAPC|nr:CMGC/DYRK/YAK protein kinase [Phakopsora pachyrhizi]
MSPRNSQSHSNLQQHQLGTPSAGGMNAYYGDPGSGSAAPASAIPRVLTYSPSQYALRPHNSSINNSHSSPSANTPKTNPSSASITTSGSLLPQHHSIQLGLFSSSQVNPNVAYSNQSSALPPPPAYATISPGNPPYYSHHNHSIPLASSNSMATNLPPLSSFLNSATSLRPNAIQSGSQSSSQAPQTEHYYGSRSASGASSHRPRRATEDIGFRRIIQGAVDLRPVIHNPPSERRLDPINGGYISPLKALTIHLASTYRLINPNFRYELSLNPRRVLTKPSKPAGNNGMDNEDSDYILYVNDILGHKYLILDVLGQGTFGQVVKCQDMKTHEVVAVKVVKNKQAYFSQSMMEVTILELLNNTWDAENKHHILRMKDTFIHQNHLCLVFELLSSNLYELIKQNSFRGLSTSLVRVFTNQLLDALTVLNEAHLIHCDLKPENILLTSLSSPEIKVIDFGSACHERQTVYTYIQSRFYRSPEVILGLPYSSAIDMWSLGCICVELFLGLPLFPGTSEYNQISRIIEMLGTPPTYMLEVGKQTLQFFDVVDDFEGGRKTYTLKSIDQYSKEHHVQEQPSKRYFAQNTLEDIISQYPVLRKGLKPADLEKEKQNRIAFIDFVKGLLNINPIERWSPQQARLHPFILGEPLREPYVPMKSSYQSGIGGASTKLSETKPKSLGHSSQAQADNQARSQPVNNSKGIIAGMGVSEASIKRPYGGLPAAPARSGQKVYDAAAYSQLQAQQQAINAQAAAIPHNPHPSNIGSMPPSAISIPHSFYNARGGPMSGPLTAGSLPSSNLSTIAHNQLPYNPQLGHSGGIGNGGSNIGNAVLIGRQRSGTLDQMDLVPPQLARVQSDLTNYAGQSVTPILRRDDQYLAWEQRQHSGVAGTIGVGGNLSRRPSHRTNPQLDYLHEQVG